MKKLYFVFIMLTTTLHSLWAQTKTHVTSEESLLGSLAPIINGIHASRGFPMDYAHKGELPLEEWRERGRAEVQRVFSYAPENVSLDIKVHSVVKRKGYEIRTISLAGSSHYRVP